MEEITQVTIIQGPRDGALLNKSEGDPIFYIEREVNTFLEDVYGNGYKVLNILNLSNDEDFVILIHHTDGF